MKLTDSQIRHIFHEVAKGYGEPHALYHYARVVELSTAEDFRILRAVSLVLIRKYELGQYLEKSESEMLVHNFPSVRRSA